MPISWRVITTAISLTAIVIATLFSPLEDIQKVAIIGPAVGALAGYLGKVNGSAESSSGS